MLDILKLPLKFIGKIFNKNYGSELENYIISRSPKNTGDVERYTMEYNSKLQKDSSFL